MRLGNDLIDHQLEVLGLLQEECAEVIQEVSKIRRTGMNFCRKGGTVPNKLLFQHEVIDVLVLIHFACQLGLIDEDYDSREYIDNKKERLKEWTNLPHSLIESI